jgi:hypothetical protein
MGLTEQFSISPSRPGFCPIGHDRESHGVVPGSNDGGGGLSVDRSEVLRNAMFSKRKLRTHGPHDAPPA